MLLPTSRGRNDSPTPLSKDLSIFPLARENIHKIHLHFVGIGGIGMSGLAEVFCKYGYTVSGSDLKESETTRKLTELGIPVHIGHSEKSIQPGTSVVIISSAVKSTNPEVLEAKKKRIPVIPRAEILGELMRGKIGVAVAGTHGKTTTTSMLSYIITTAGLDPTLVIGGKVDQIGGNAKLGLGEIVVAEADESDGSFLHLPATFSIITNIDNDHLDHFGNLEKIDQAFIEFEARIPFYGIVAVCGEDPGIQRCLSQFQKPYLTYGWSPQLNYAALELQPKPKGFRFKVVKNVDGDTTQLGFFETSIPGKHNVLNALAALVIADHFRISHEKIALALKEYRGARRRFEIIYENTSKGMAVVDDYAHHPTEIMATLAAARGFWKGKIKCLFQPHRFTRTRDNRDGYLSAFRECDEVWISDIYAAGETPIEGVSAQGLVEAIQAVVLPGQSIQHVGDIEQALPTILRGFEKGDLLILMGAGSITSLGSKIIQHLENK